jgi:hypothetical protein
MSADPDRFIERGGRDSGHPELQRSLLKLRHEFLAEQRKQRERGQKEASGNPEGQALAGKRDFQQRQVDPFNPAQQKRVLLAARPQDQGGEHRNERHGEHERADHREGDGERHRLEQLAFER